MREIKLMFFFFLNALFYLQKRIFRRHPSNSKSSVVEKNPDAILKTLTTSWSKVI
jgi:hypothetical protein